MKKGGYWHDENKTFPVCYWQYEVASGDTLRGYWEWVKSKKEKQAEENGHE